MKKLLLSAAGLGLVVMLTVMSCKKEEDPQPTTTSTSTTSGTTTSTTSGTTTSTTAVTPPCSPTNNTLTLGANNYSFGYFMGLVNGGKYQLAAQATASTYPGVVLTFGTSTVTSGVYNIVALASAANEVQIYFNTSISTPNTAYTGVSGQVYVNVSGSQIVCTLCSNTWNNSTSGNATATGKITKP